MRPCLAALALLFVLPGGSVAAAPEPRLDAFLAGYATAVLAREFDVVANITVVSGTVQIEATPIGFVDRKRFEQVLTEVEGVQSFEWIGVRETPRAQGAAAAPGDSSAQPMTPREIVFLPDRRLFAPLLADPRWPHFSASYQRYLGDRELRNVGSAAFGESFALLQTDAPFGGRYELGLQAGVFSIFDFDSESFDLVNSDFLAAVTNTWRRSDLGVQLRFYHQSSHLGDEFLLRNRVERINLSFEAFDLLLSYDVNEFLRIYGGGGLLLRSDPPGLDRGMIQMGAELSSAHTILDGLVRPVGALDLQLREESNWAPDLSVRVGFQLENRRLGGRRLLLLFE